MKKLGLIFISIGLALFLYVIYNIILENNKALSPIPENTGVKVIFVTPSK